METTTTAIKERPILFSGPMVRAILEGRKTQTRRVIDPQPKYWPEKMRNCPYGVPGDRLYAKETFNVGWLDGGKVLYRADGGSAKECGYPKEPKWKSPLFMRRSESRLTLEITDVLVERVQSISEEDAIAEGTKKTDLGAWQGRPGGHPRSGIFSTWDNPQHAYLDIWNSINAKRGHGWEKNPWVWALSFKVVHD